MPNSSSNRPITFRPTKTLLTVLDSHIEATKQVRSRFIRAAILEKLKRERTERRPSSHFPE